MRILFYIIVGLIFGAGLTVSGMVDPNKVLNFFDLFGTWDPSLAFVMAGGLAVNIVGYQVAKSMKKPVLDMAFPTDIPTKVDRNLILGSALFGVGWGIAGFCPGPAIVALGALNIYPFVFVFAVLAGMALVRTVQSQRS